MSNRELMQRAEKLFNSDLVSERLNRRNRLAWCRSTKRLGNKWLLSQPVEKGVNA